MVRKEGKACPGRAIVSKLSLDDCLDIPWALKGQGPVQSLI